MEQLGIPPFLDLPAYYSEELSRTPSVLIPLQAPCSCSHQSYIDWFSDGWGHATPSPDRMLHHICSVYEQETEVITRLGLPDHRGNNQNLLQVHGTVNNQRSSGNL